ncbi:hypothetical protein JCM10213_007855 [Rhodosporidiobolus nylandii]
MNPLQAMMGGAECSTSSNPLSGLLKQQHGGEEWRQTHGVGGSGSAQESSMRSSASPSTGQMGTDEADRFFQQQQLGPGPMSMEGMRRELESVSRGPGGVMRGDKEWASQYSPAGSSLSHADMARMEEQFRMQQQQGRPDFASEFNQQLRFTPSPVPAFSTAPPAASSSTAFSRPGFAPSYGAYGGGMMGMRAFAPSGLAQPQPAMQQDVKGKGRFVELDDAGWEAQFAKAGEAVEAFAPQASETQTAQQDTVNVLDGEIELDTAAADQALLRDLESTWSSLKGQLDASNATDAELARWESQFGSQFNDLHGGLEDDFDDEDLLQTPDIRRPRQWTRDNVDSFLQDDRAFPYAEENKYLEHQDPYAEGMRLLAEGAPLSEAALAFEAACRMDESRAEAWKAAGETWAADEREVKGIRALENAVACGGPAGIAAWMSLAVAYVNEGQELRALATLEKWISLAYPSITLPPLDTSSLRSPWDASNRVIDLFIAAAQAGPQSRAPGQSDELGVVDPDVQVGLGVLFYSNSEYDKAKDCWEAALSMRPNDFLLWNRLGATLANGGHSESAIDAYRRALDLRPTFTRAIYNLGVSCLNIGCYQEAAEHLLAALQGQMTREEARGQGKDADGGRLEPEDGSANLWHTLRRAFLCMDRHDLADKALPGADLNQFRAEGFEF